MTEDNHPGVHAAYELQQILPLRVCREVKFLNPALPGEFAR